jgi:hypothetical protein
MEYNLKYKMNKLFDDSDISKNTILDISNGALDERKCKKFKLM